MKLYQFFPNFGMMIETTYMKLWVTEPNFFGAKNFAPKIRKIDQKMSISRTNQ